MAIMRENYSEYCLLRKRPILRRELAPTKARAVADNRAQALLRKMQVLRNMEKCIYYKALFQHRFNIIYSDHPFVTYEQKF